MSDVRDQMEVDITRIVAEVIEMDADELWGRRDQKFAEALAVDSMLSLEMLTAVEKHFRIEIPEENVLDLVSLDETIGFVRAKLAESAA